MKVGSMVCAINPRHTLHCGSGAYTHAIVTSMEPFILVSEGCDMRWSATVKPEDFYHVTTAEPHILKACMERMYVDFPAMRPNPIRDVLRAASKRWVSTRELLGL